ncbi:MAG TPA: CBS domain-containing protein [Caulobacteraceae bacterium]|jgi:CBS domain-containing protein|nr:CBS domain-containing protein [Caulobacteraceae bacterium]HEX4097331.1 CBS domain-containing protein [Caulobacteraceae bacterium]
MLVSQILKEKGDMVFTASPSDSVAAVAALLQSRRVGAMVVLDESQNVAGIVSERDIVRVVAEVGAEGLSQPISACMTRDVVFAEPQETVDALLARMTDRRIRHLPVCRASRLVGIISIGDLVKSKIAETVAEAENLKAYISA